MGKYIDAEKLISEIKLRIESAAQKADISSSVDDVENEKKYDDERNVLERVLELVISLQHEQPEVDLETFDKRVTKMWERCAAEPNDTIACLHIDSFIEIARHFFELGLTQKGE